MSQKEEWSTRKWRPYLGMSYIAICLFDFIVGPVLNYIFFVKVTGTFQPWKPLTMSDGGLFHMAMGAVLGVTSWTRGQEKQNRLSYGSSEPAAVSDDSPRKG